MNDLKNFLEDPINKEYLGIYKKQVQLKYHNEVLDLVEKEVEKILECSCNDCFDEKAELKLSINNLRVN